MLKDVMRKIYEAHAEFGARFAAEAADGQVYRCDACALPVRHRLQLEPEIRLVPEDHPCQPGERDAAR